MNDIWKVTIWKPHMQVVISRYSAKDYHIYNNVTKSSLDRLRRVLRKTASSFFRYNSPNEFSAVRFYI